MADQPNAFAPIVPPVETPPVNEPPVVPNANPYADLLTRIVNEDGKPKYNTLEDALKALEHSQKFIPQLQSEAAEARRQAEELRAQVEKFGSIEEVVNRLTAQNQQAAKPEDQQQVSGLDEQAAATLFQKLLNETRQQESAVSNEKTVNDALIAKYGDKASEVVAEKAKELGATPEEIRVLASQKPAMVLALFNTTASNKAGPAIVNGQRTTLNPPTQPELVKPVKSLLGGATSKEQAAYMREIKAHVYQKHGITN